MIKELFISPDGNNFAQGSIDSPFKTLSDVKNKLQQIYDGKTPVTIYFRGGIYPINENSTVFSEEDSASENARITYCAYKDEKPLFEGGIKLDLSKAEPVTDDSIKSRIIDLNARKALHKLNISEYIELMPHPSEKQKIGGAMLFRDGEPMNFARWPSKKHGSVSTEERWLFSPNIIHGDSPHDSPFKLCTDPSVTDHIKHFWSEASLEDAWLAGYLFHNWSYDIYKVLKADNEHSSIIATKYGGGTLPYLCEPEPCFKYRRFYFYNILEELCDPLEYYIDYENKLLYFCADNSSSEIRIVTPTEPVFTFNNASNITIDGLSFRCSAKEFIIGNHSNGITVQNCDFSIGAGNGLNFNTCNELKLIHNHICYMGSAGILAYGAGNTRTLTPGNILIEDNDIHDVSLKKPCGSCTINMWSSVGTIVRHNRLHGSPHMLMFIDGIDTLVEYNEIYDAALDTDDSAAVYWGRTATTIGTRIRYNYFHDIGQNNTGTWSIGAIYTDDNATGAEICGNLFINAAIFGDDNTYKLNCRKNAVVCLNAAQFSYVHDNIMFMSTERNVPMSNTCHRDMLEWIKNTIGAYIPGNFKTRSSAFQWHEHLQSIGFYDNDGISPSELWHEHYKNTIWEDMFELLSYENYTAGAKDAQGKAYGIPDIIGCFEQGKLDAEQAVEAFDAYVKAVAKKYGEKYSTNKFERNVIINMATELLNENGVFEFNNTPNSANLYITVEQAEKYFEDIHNVNYSLTAEGKKAIECVIPQLDHLC